ncbi:hypothetical protein CUZ56_01215 [Saezia sanguinis]|uniref:Uncharacterized protein n=1 Tax=Saezia sanguinis TaxID=1965230 RepID=A0A433SEW9_9BURK|nr:hypothetical protein [Saezia sanguinis]RUS67272.1 hypothetical protein CUZ56_01215 [Saezia sanguinis]
MPQFTKTSQWKRFDNFKKGLEFSREIYTEAIQEYGLNEYQAFSFLYEEIDSELFSSDKIERFKAYTALFFCAYEHKVDFILDDPFTENVFDRLKNLYKDFYSNSENLKNIPDMQDEESQKIIRIVKENYVKN